MDETARQRQEAIDDVGEFGLIDRIHQIVGPSKGLAGIGDDAALLDLGGPEALLATADMLVQDVHFRRDVLAHDLGRRAIAVSVSDIAAMGGSPRHALVSLALPPGTSAAWVEALYQGMDAEARRWGAGIVGGNLTRTSGPICIDVVLLGSVPRDEVVPRSGGHIGDVLAVTGTLGNAAALRLAREHGLDLTRLVDPEWIERASAVHPRVHEGRALAGTHLAHAMLDVSDGLAGDVEHLCRASGLGAEIDANRVPIAAEVERIAGALDLDPLELALTGGEDYELLVAMNEDEVARAGSELASAHLHVLGRLVRSEWGIRLIDDAGEGHPIEVDAWRHF